MESATYWLDPVQKGLRAGSGLERPPPGLSRWGGNPSKEADKEPQRLILHGLRLGEAALVTLSAEVFVEFATYGEGVSSFDETLVLGYTDGSIGYLCTADTHPEGGYEARTTSVPASPLLALVSSWSASVPASF